MSTHKFDYALLPLHMCSSSRQFKCLKEKHGWDGEGEVSDLCYVVNAGQGEAMSSQIISLRFQRCEFGLHHMFLPFTLFNTEAHTVQFQQSQTHLGGHLNVPERL